MATNPIAVLPGPRTSFLDHLVPLCHFVSETPAPLVCTDQWVYTCALTYYPKMELFFAEEGTLASVLSNFDTYITVEPCRLHQGAFQFGKEVVQGKAQTIAGFHGNPEKFREEYWIERYAHEDLVLVYGEHSVDYLKEKGVWPRLKKTESIGNLRKRFYHLHQPFFDALTTPFLFPPSTKKTLLLAPTWSYPDPPVSLLTLLNSIPQDLQVLLKLHPFTYRLHPEFVSHVKTTYKDHEQIHFLPEIPLVYPFIQKADLYLGECASVAFDFLSVNRPLFFLGGKTYPFATTLQESNFNWSALTREDRLSEARLAAYARTFD